MASTSTSVKSAPIQVTGTVDMRNNSIKGLETDLTLYPTVDSDGASKKYVDSVRDDILTQLPLYVDNGSF